MYFHHLHFYVKDTSFWKQWFCQKLAFEPQLHRQNSLSAAPSVSPSVLTTHTDILQQGGIEIRLSAPAHHTQVADYLSAHPQGLVDVALATEAFAETLSRALEQGAQLLQPVTCQANGQRQCQLKGWKHLRHTLVEVSSQWARAHQHQPVASHTATQGWLEAIDHVVLNVPQGELEAAVSWYQKIFGLQRSQSFDINTARSGLRSQVLVHPDGPLQLPINEPTSANSQVQEFLDHNRGTGVQHVALRSRDAVGAIAHFRWHGLRLIDVPDTYYQGLKSRNSCPLSDLSAIQQQRLLIDWPQVDDEGGDQGMLLQTFTQPIFAEPTFFFEVIERRAYQVEGQLQSTKGFGEGNFQALFEAIERSQLERASLSPTAKNP